MGTTTETRITSTQAKDAIYKAHSISSPPLDIDNAVLSSLYINPSFLNEDNCVIDYINMDILDGGYIDTGWIPNTSKDFTIVFVGKNDGFGTYQEQFSGVEETDSILIGRTRNTTSAHFGIWVKDETVNKIGLNSEYLPAITVLTMLSYSASLKKITWANSNGNIRDIQLTDGIDAFTKSFYIGATNINGTVGANRVIVGDFAVYPKYFSYQDFSIQYSMFIKKWNLDTFTKKVNPDMTSKEMYEYVYRSGVLLDSYNYSAHKRQYLNTRLFSADRVAFVGDSITHGVGSTDVKNKKWSARLRKHINILNYSDNYGFESTYYYGGDFSNTSYHQRSYLISGANWTYEDVTASGLLGYEAYSSTLNEGMIFTVPSLLNQKKFRIYGINAVSTAGSYEVYVNNILVGTETLAATATRLTKLSALYDLTDNGSGACVIKTKIISGTVGLQGVEYMASSTDKIINIYATSGRKTRDVSETAISQIMSNNKVVYWCLGYNDKGLATVPADWAKIQQVLDWVKSYAIANNTFVIFCDFMWNDAITNLVKLKMKETSNAIGYNSLYIEMSSNITSDAVVNANSSYLLTDLGAWADTAHPNDKGHSLVFNNVRLECGL